MFKFMPRICIESNHFYSCHRSSLKTQAELFDNLLSPTTERGEEKYDLPYQSLIRKYEDDLEHG